MIRPSLLKPFLLATLISGTLDILLAVFLTLQRGKDPAGMLRFVASGPFPAATEWGGGGALLGLAVHFTLMAIMVGGFFVLISQRPHLLDRPLLAGLAFGLITRCAGPRRFRPSPWASRRNCSRTSCLSLCRPY
jgi:hypothetical protein